MLVLLEENVPNLGAIGDLVKVKPGFARNYLLPRSLAVLANESNQKQLAHLRRQAEVKKQKALSAAQQLATAISALSLTVHKPVGEEDKIFGAVTTQELAAAFTVAGYELDRRLITILDDIKRVGVYKGSVKLHPEVSAQFNIWVVAQG
ncbi:MAG: 50S ribosomal protein L9 [Bdellovibrionota bacterium]